MLRSEKTGSKAKAYAVLRQRIITGAIAPGEPIDETALATELGTSRTPVREALLLLEQEGLVRIVPRVGYFATEIDISDLLETCEVRLLIEPAVTYLAAQRITPPELQVLYAVAGLTAEEATPANFSQAVDLNREFHVRVAQASGNRQLAQLMANLMDKLARFKFYELSSGATSGDWRAEHLRIIRALELQDPVLAARQIQEILLTDKIMLAKGSWVSLGQILTPTTAVDGSYKPNDVVTAEQEVRPLQRRTSVSRPGRSP